jgi:hypothetical protein
MPAPVGWREERTIAGRRNKQRSGRWEGRRQPTGAALGGAAELPTPGPQREYRGVLGCGYCASGGGAPAPGWPRHPPPTTRASRADPRRHPPASLPSVKAVLTWRAPAAARSHDGRVEGDGMANALHGELSVYGTLCEEAVRRE